MISPENLKFISDLVDEIALEKPLDFESYNFDAVKEVAIQGAVEQYFSSLNNSELNSEEKDLINISTIAYLMLENTILWLEIKRRK